VYNELFPINTEKLIIVNDIKYIHSTQYMQIGLISNLSTGGRFRWL